MKSSAIGRMYKRLTPIAHLQWQSSRSLKVRARIIVALAHLLGTHISLAMMQRLSRFNSQPVAIYLDTLVYYVDASANEIVPLFEIYDRKMYDQLPGFAAGSDQVVVDIGANIGAFTLWQAQRGATVYAYEPNLSSFTRLCRAVESNKLTGRVHATNQAVGAWEGRGTLLIPERDSTASTLRADSTGPISVTTLTTICKKQGLIHIDILKIDAEGSEASILEGGDTVLDHIDRLVLEYHSVALEDRCRGILVEHGFAILQQTVVDPEAGAGVMYAERSPR